MVSYTTYPNHSHIFPEYLSRYSLFRSTDTTLNSQTFWGFDSNASISISSTWLQFYTVLLLMTLTVVCPILPYPWRRNHNILPVLHSFPPSTPSPSLNLLLLFPALGLCQQQLRFSWRCAQQLTQDLAFHSLTLLVLALKPSGQELLICLSHMSYCTTSMTETELLAGFLFVCFVFLYKYFT